MTEALEARPVSESIIDSIDVNIVERTIQKIHDFQTIVQQALKPGHDYGIIPGCDKPSLLKPGAEKINMMMGVTAEYEIMEKTEDYEKGFFAYNVKCRLSRNGYTITEGVGNCNSRERKYINQDACSIANTILKMAKKRAYIDATLTVASLSDIFTQDIDDPDMRITGKDYSNEDNKGKSAEEQVITFGRHKGKTLGEIFREDRGYFDWLLENNNKMKPHCEAFLKSLEKADKPMDAETETKVDEGKEQSDSVSEDEIRKLFSIAKKATATNDDVKAVMLDITGKDSTSKLTREEYDIICGLFKSGEWTAHCLAPDFPDIPDDV